MRHSTSHRPEHRLRQITVCCWLVIGGCFGSLVEGSWAEESDAAIRPNFVVVFIDDMGYADIGSFGSTLNRTPQLDRMAEEGLRLTSFYAAPVCSASRAQLLTGSYAPRVSIPGVLFPAAARGLNPNEVTIAKVLRELGYATACIGKWHLGDQPEFLPTRHGFDRYFGIPYSNDMQRVSVETGQRVTPLLRDEQVIELLEDPEQSQITARYTDEAIRFIHDSKDGPFFLYLPHTAVHVPIYPGEPFRGRSENGRYGDWVEELDWSTGRILDTLRELDLADRTLVMFTSDNGPWASKGADGGLATPLRGAKGGTFEGGVRVPTIVWWPGTIPARSNSGAISGTTDLLPTFTSLAGGQLPPEHKIDGRDISDLLLGRTDQSPHEAWFYYQGTRLQAVRSGPWKLALTGQSEGMGLPRQPDAATGGRLYHLEKDLGETTDLAGEHPEVVQRLQELAAAMAADIGDGPAGPGVRPAGQVENPVTLFPVVAKPKPSAPVRPAALDSLSIGDAVRSAAAPQVANRPLHITCQVGAAAEHGVILAHGGSVVGYALHFREGQVVFSVRTSRTETFDITAKQMPPGPLAIDARLAEDGTMTLSLNGQLVAEGRASSLIPRQPEEDFCVGHDNGNPVASYDGPDDRFAGEVTRIQVLTR